MSFTHKAPVWNAEGVEPSEDLKNQGFTAGYKPPADYFNYMFNNYQKCIDELQTASETTENVVKSNYIELRGGLETTNNAVNSNNADITTIKKEYAKKDDTRLTGTTYVDNGIVAASEETDNEGEPVYTQKSLVLNDGVYISADGQELDAEVLKQAGVALDNIYGKKTTLEETSAKAQTALDTASVVGDALTETQTTVQSHSSSITTLYQNKANIDGSNARGTWSIDISGTAAKATNDSGGNKIVDTYATKTELETAVDEVAVGGTNLLINTTTFEGYENICNITTEHFLGHNVWKYTIPSTPTSFITILGKSNIKIETDEYYTLSFYAKGTGRINTYFFRPSGSLVESGYNNIGSTARAGDGAIGIDLTNEWKRYITTWKVHKSSTLSLSTKEVSADLLIARFESGQVAGNNISICGVKLEKGNKATDWTPAPEDIAATYAPIDSPEFTTAISMGRKYYTTVGAKSIAVGNVVTASGGCSQAFGQGTAASGICSQAIGDTTTASGQYSVSEGQYTTASGNCSHASGYNTTALAHQFSLGHFNNTYNAAANSEYGTSSGTAFVIGNGSSSTAPSNAFRVTGNGETIAKMAYSTTGADYAEFAEWEDGNPDNEDRRGYFVTRQGIYIRKANAGEWIDGVISAMPSVVGNYDEEWYKRYVLDDFGAFIEETFEYQTEEVIGVDEETGEPIIETKTKTGTRWKENPEYDKNKEYIPRENRQEWDKVGMVGVVAVRDDGTCQVNGFCKCADGGIATSAEPSEHSYLTPIYRVLDRVTDNIVKIRIS